MKKLGRLESKKVAKKIAERAQSVDNFSKKVNVKEWYEKIMNNQTKYQSRRLFDRIGNRTFVSDILRKGGESIVIDDYLWQLDQYYSINKLPQLKIDTEKNQCFSFGRDLKNVAKNQKEMFETEKTLINVSTSISTEAHKNIILGFYALANKLDNELLPQIYCLKVIASPDKSYYRLRVSAIVAGCEGGECPLFQINSPFNSSEQTKLFVWNSGYTNENPYPLQKVSSITFNLHKLPEITSFEDACKFAFDKCNLNYRLNVYTPDDKISNILNRIKDSRDALVKIDGSVVDDFFQISLKKYNRVQESSQNDDGQSTAG